MPQKDTTTNGTNSLEASAINRSRSLSRSFKNLFSGNPSETAISQASQAPSQQRSVKPKVYNPNGIASKDTNLAQQAALNNAAKTAAKSDAAAAKSASKSISPTTSAPKPLLAPGSLDQSSDESPVSDFSSDTVSPLLKSTLPATPTLLKNMNATYENSNLIDEELDNKKDESSGSSNFSDNTKKHTDVPILNLGERSGSGRGRSTKKSTNTNKSGDASPLFSSREGSLSPQRSVHQYRSRGMSVSQANFSQPHLAVNTVNDGANIAGHIKRSATLVKGNAHGDNRGVMVNNRHMIWESETFKLYRNFTHEHKLSALPLIDVNPDLLTDTDAMKEIIDMKNKETSSFSLGTLFKLHKTTQQVKETGDDKSMQLLHSSKGYIPSKSELQSNNQFNLNAPHCKQVVKINAYCTTMKKKKAAAAAGTESSDKNSPTIVNPRAAISIDELHLINDLTNKMKSLIAEDTPEYTSKSDGKESDFRNKYGYCAGTLGQGAYGIVKVTCRKLKENTDYETKNSIPYIVDNIAKKSFRFRDCVFFAVKELQANKKNMNKFEIGNESDDSENDSEESLDNSDNSMNDAESSTDDSDLFITKLAKHRKRINKDYNAKFSTRLTSEFVIGHALNNIGRHPNILKIFDLYQYDNFDNKFLQVMEFCPSGDLHSLIKRMAQAGNGNTVSKDVELPPIGAGPVFIGDTLNLMDGGTGFQKENGQSSPPLAKTGESNVNCSSPIIPNGKLSDSQQNLLDMLIQRKQEKHSLLHPLEIDCFMKQIINGVAFMHHHGVAHCDLKPENILFKPNGILKISDFGTSCVFQTAWEKKPHYQSGCFGSEPYMSPEQFIPKKQYDPRLVDTFAVGVIYVTMAMGHYPWKSPIKEKDPDFAEFIDSLKVVIPYNAETKQQEIITGEYEPFEEMIHVNAEIRMLRKKCLYRMLHPNPNKRVLIKDVLNSNWMKRTHCCVIYKNNILE